MNNTDSIAEHLEKTNKYLKDLIIIQLLSAGVAQNDVQGVVGGSTAYINSIAKLINKKKPKTKSAE